MRVCRGHRSVPYLSTPRGGIGRWPGRHRQRGVAAIEFALLFLFGVLPLLLLTFSGVMIFAAKQSLELAAADGARAALQYQATDAARLARATSVAGNRMQWLLNFSGATPAQATSVSEATCYTGITCLTVKTFYDYDAHPFLPGTEALYGWALGGSKRLESSATIQLPAGS